MKKNNYLFLLLISLSVTGNPLVKEWERLKNEGKQVKSEAKKTSESIKEKSKEIISVQKESLKKTIDQVEEDLKVLKTDLKKEIKLFAERSELEGSLTYASASHQVATIKADYQSLAERITIEYFRSVGKITPKDYSELKEKDKLQYDYRRAEAALKYEEKIYNLRLEYLNKYNFYQSYQVSNPEPLISLFTNHQNKIKSLYLKLGHLQSSMSKIN